MYVEPLCIHKLLSSLLFPLENDDKEGAYARNFLDPRELRPQSNGTHIPEKEKCTV